MIRLNDISVVVGKALRDLRDRLHSRQIVPQKLPGYELEVYGGNWMAAGGAA